MRPLLRRVVLLFRQRLPRARVVVRLDAGFASGEFLDLLDGLGVGHLVGIAKNSRLAVHAERHIRATRCLAKPLDRTTALFGACDRGARAWSRERHVGFPAEVIALAGRDVRDNLPFVVTNLRRGAEAVWNEHV